MERPLVVTDSSDSAVDLIREAGELAEANDVPLFVLTVVTADEFNSDAKVLNAINSVEEMPTANDATSYAQSVANSAVSDLLSDLDLETETIGKSVESDDERANTILEVAERLDCDYIFLVGKRRSPTGKAIFGDTAQAVILNFDGYVVTVSE